MQGLKAYIGNQRSGKTYTAVLDIVDDLLPSGGTYYGNIAGLDYDVIARTVERRHGEIINRSQFNPLTSAEIGDWFKTVPDGSTVDGYNASVGLFIDEVHLFFNALKRGPNLLEVANRMCQLGKTGIALRIIAPNYKQIDTQLRNQIQEIWLHRDCKQLPVFRYASALIPSMILRIQMSTMDGKATGERDWVYKEQEIFACYKSFAVQFDSTRGTVGLAKLKKSERARKMKLLKQAASAALLLATSGGCYWDRAEKYEQRLKVMLEKAEVASKVQAISASRYLVVVGNDEHGDFAWLNDGSELRAGGPDGNGNTVSAIFNDRVRCVDGANVIEYRKKPFDLLVNAAKASEAVHAKLPDEPAPAVQPGKQTILNRVISPVSTAMGKVAK